ncbi:unnamed protein product [Agarophyton chilense]
MSEPLTDNVARGTRSAMELIYGLRACGVEHDIAIPQVAVIGDQSSGKSSVLEAICSVPLPRGAGLTTRCAIELRLSSTHPGDLALPPDSEPPKREPFWISLISTSLNPKQIPLEGKHELEDAIAARAASLTDSRQGGGFSKERVIVHIAATGSPNLTIIDLPGIIRTKTFGDFIPFIPNPFGRDSQDRNTIRQVSELIQGYAAQERTIMLVVVPATQDVATIEALEWAARYDPAGRRTIGVITKPDLVDKGAEKEVASVLLNRRKPLKLGYVMMKNRSQIEVQENVSVQQARKNEYEFFATHPVFSKMKRSYFGVDNLVKKVTSVLVARVHDEVPKMRSEVVQMLEQCTQELQDIGQGAGETPAEANMTLMRIVFEYNNLLTESAAGRYVDKRLWSSRLRLCTRVRDVYDHFKGEVEGKRPPFDGDSKFIDEVENEIRNSRGRELPGFLNPRIFESRVARYVEDWRDASNKLVAEVRRLVSEVAVDLLSTLAPEFPGLRNRMQEIVSEVLHSLEKSARKELTSVFDREVGQPFTMNEQFLTAVNTKRLERFDAAVVVALSRAGRDPRGNIREKNVSDMLRAWYQSYYCSSSAERVRADAEDMSTMLGCYWDVSAKRFIDNNVMVIDTTIIRPLAQEIHVPLNELVLKVGTSQQALENLLQEDPVVTSRRKTLRAKQERLRKAQELLDRF